jgi:hypothetical protein
MIKNIYKITFLITVLVMGSGCKKFLDINKSPANPQVVSAELLLAPIIFQMTNGTGQDNRIVWKITQDMVGTSTDVASRVWETHGFPAASDVGGVVWRMTYVNLGLNLENMINDAIANQKYEYAAIGYAIKAWSYQVCTDMYGPIILDAAYTPNMLAFPYQDQPDVYAKVREWGNLSIKYSKMTSPISYSAQLKSVSGDGIYGGDMAKWRKFVYGLFALQYSHLINKPNFASNLADSVKKYTDLSFVNDTEDATVYFTASIAADSNPLGLLQGLITSSTTYYGRPTTQILNYLTGGMRGTPTVSPKTSVDPRLTRMLTPLPTTGVYVGATPTQGSNTPLVPIVLGNLPAGTGSTYPGRYLFNDAARYPIMSYAQLQFAKAEAQFIKGEKADAYTSYIKGIRGHFDFYNLYGRASKTAPDPVLSDAEYNAYIASTEVAKGPADLTIMDIMGQKYVAQWGWAGIEQWCDIRKYHYRADVYRNYFQIPASDLAITGKYAYRFRPRYNSEYVWNANELAKWGALDRDYMTKETWFSLSN